MNLTRAHLALAFICIVWGTTYLAIRIAVANFPPLLFAGIRQLSAGLILLLFVMLFRRAYTWTAANVARQALAGILMITLGNGLVTWAVQFVPSGLAALICSTMPACVVFLNLAVEKEFRLNWAIVGGLLAGTAGMVAIFSQNLSDLANPNYVWGIVVIFLATLSWAIGSIYSKGISQNNPFANAALQLSFGGFFQLVWSAIFENWASVSMMSLEAFCWLLYLIVFGSVLAFVAYLYALSKLPVGLTSIYAYINPLVAVVLGWLVLNEQLTLLTGAAFILVVVGLYGISLGYKLQKTVEL